MFMVWPTLVTRMTKGRQAGRHYHVCGTTREKYHKLQPKSKTTHELKVALQTIWEDLPRVECSPGVCSQCDATNVNVFKWTNIDGYSSNTFIDASTMMVPLETAQCSPVSGVKVSAEERMEVSSCCQTDPTVSAPFDDGDRHSGTCAVAESRPPATVTGTSRVDTGSRGGTVPACWRSWKSDGQ